MSKAKKKRFNPAPIIVLAVLVLLIAAALVYLLRPAADPAREVEPEETIGTTLTLDSSITQAQLAEALGEEDSDLETLSDDQMVHITDVCAKADLPEEWMNVLLLGSDERVSGASSRTDAMIICSINTKTGEVKLTSIMRDTAVEYTDLGDMNGTYRINAANYFGGEALAMKMINECLGMNITGYVHVNFFGFQQIAQQLGGIDVDVTEAEMEEINKRIVEQAKYAYKQGLTEDAENIPYQFLESYGENTHLDGRMTLAYARLRHVDNDYSRAERQRTVLIKLLKKLKGLGAAELLNIGTAAMPYVTTNLTLDQILQVALVVTGNGFDASSVQTMRVPVNGSYVQEQRNGQYMLYDTDWVRNATELYSFIYDS